MFNIFTPTTALFYTYEHMGLCLMRNKEKSVIQKKLEKKVTTPETETASPSAGSSGRGGD